MSDAELFIAPGKVSNRYWGDLWRYRELFWQLAKRDIAVRYKQTAIGMAWAVVRPLLTMVVFTVVFGSLAKLPSDGGTPYALMVFAAMLPWYLFSSALSAASESMIAGTTLIGKVYFPRLIIPVSSMMVAIVDFLVSLALLLLLMAWFRVMPDWRIATLPLFTVLAFLAAAGPGIWFAAINLKYRDFRFIVPFIVQLGLYVSPVGFSSGIVPEEWRLLYSINPMVGVIDGFRWCLLGADVTLDPVGLSLSICLSLFLLLLGLRKFRSTERHFADIV